MEKDTEALNPVDISDTNTKVRVYPDGLVHYARMITVKLRCPFNFQVRHLVVVYNLMDPCSLQLSFKWQIQDVNVRHYWHWSFLLSSVVEYPLDEKTCHFIISAVRDFFSEWHYVWNQLPIYIISDGINLDSFTYDCTYTQFPQAPTCSGVSFTFRRGINYFVLQVGDVIPFNFLSNTTVPNYLIQKLTLPSVLNPILQFQSITYPAPWLWWHHGSTVGLIWMWETRYSSFS